MIPRSPRRERFAAVSVLVLTLLASALASSTPARAQVATGTATWSTQFITYGSWTDPSNWSTSPPGNYPNNGTGATNLDVTVDAAAKFARVLLDTDITVRQFTLTGSSANGLYSPAGAFGPPGAQTNLTMTGLFTWNGGPLNSLDTIAANAGMTLTQASVRPATLTGCPRVHGSSGTRTASRSRRSRTNWRATRSACRRSAIAATSPCSSTRR